MPRTIDFRYAPRVQRACIGQVDDPHKTLVREDGSLNYGYGDRPNPGDNVRPEGRQSHGHNPRHRLRPGFTHEDELVDTEQTHGDPGAAIITTTEQYQNTRLEWTTFASRTDDFCADVINWKMETSADFGRAMSEVVLELEGEAGDPPTVIAADTTDDDHHDHAPVLESGATRKGVFVVVLEGEPPADLTPEWGVEALEEARSYWEAVTPFRRTFQIPDQEINDLLTACGRNILQAREIVDGVPEYRVGPADYRGLWMVDGHFLLEAVHMMGRGEDAFEQGLIGLLRRVKPSGAIEEMTVPHHKETGIAMATIVRQCELAAADDRLEELWPTLNRALDYLKRLHAEADDETGAPFPPAMLDGGIGGPFPELTTPLWVLVGLRYAGDAGRRLDLPGHEQFNEFWQKIRNAVESCADRHRRTTDDGISYVPMNLEPQPEHNPQSATWALAHAIYPGQVFDPDDRIVTDFLNLLDEIDDTEEIPANTGWIHSQGVWAYSASFYAHAWLYAGYPQKAVDYLYSFANHATPGRVWREEQSFRDSHAARYWGDMPHNWASAEFIRLVRNCLVFERGDRLELLPGLPEEWLPSTGDPLVIDGTPTRFGSVDIKLTATEAGYRLSYARKPGALTPESVRVHWDGTVEDGNLVLDGDRSSAKLTLGR